ncbi:hypothetical protein [uncultured Erythrobacter sp.]|uniref:hypothetical protein n=1 Tax=uncultured Erythrobacter sp. TaxID=263913 RepID=UPI00261F9EC4|nr:hypothetical protein [uncultured Erythrobacter sp.]
MASAVALHQPPPRSMQLPEIVLGKPRFANQSSPYGEPDWAAIRSIEVVHMSDDPYHWKALLVRSLRGDGEAFRELLSDFGEVLQMFFDRLLPESAASQAVDETLRSVSEKLGTCDTRRSILSWLLAIAIFRVTHAQQRSLIQ